MQYIFENFGYLYCFGEVSVLDGENIDVFKNSSFTCTDQCHPQLSPIELQLEFQSTRPTTTTKVNFDHSMSVDNLSVTTQGIVF